MKLLTRLLILSAVVLGVFGPARALDVTLHNGVEVVAGQVMVSLDPQLSRESTAQEFARRGLTIARVAFKNGEAVTAAQWLTPAHRGRPERFVLLRFDPRRSVGAVLDELNRLPGVRAEPDPVRRPVFTPNDQYYGPYQQNLRQIYLERAWDRTRGAGVIVAIIDTGYAQSGLTDGAQNLLEGYDVADSDNDVDDTEGHGTQVGNVVAEATNNFTGAAGAAGDVTLLPVKVFHDGEGAAESSDVLQGIDWAVAHGAHVINMSLGGSSSSPHEAATMRDAVDANVVVVAASGNDGDDHVSYPGAYEDVIAVGSCNTHMTGDYPVRSDFSNYGDDLDVVAPGNGILAESNYGGQVAFYSAGGTSLASPHVAAAAALLIAAKAKVYTVQEIRDALETYAVRPVDQWDEEIGWGEINVYAAMEALVGPNPNQPPTAAIMAEPRTGPAPLTVKFTAGATDPDGNIAGFHWSFSTGETFNAFTFEYEFKDPGEYTVYLTVTDDLGDSGSASTVIEVEKPPRTKADDNQGGCGIAPAGGAGDAVTLLVMGVGLALWRRTWARRDRNA